MTTGCNYNVAKRSKLRPISNIAITMMEQRRTKQTSSQIPQQILGFAVLRNDVGPTVSRFSAPSREKSWQDTVISPAKPIMACEPSRAMWEGTIAKACKLKTLPPAGKTNPPVFSPLKWAEGCWTSIFLEVVFLECQGPSRSMSVAGGSLSPGFGTEPRKGFGEVPRIGTLVGARTFTQKMPYICI